ncbi:MAG: Ig-like domain-containing protein [Halobacteriaceae archaeon]
MRFRDDERAVTIQIGAVLFFAIVVIIISLYQAQAIPDQNKEIEFSHNQRVQDRLIGLRNAILQTAATGNSIPTSIPLGTRYPERILFVNPAPPTGKLFTKQLGNKSRVWITNATAKDADVQEYWNGSTITFPTKGIVYSPSYFYYSNAPTTIYENTLLFNQFDSATVMLTDQELIEGNQINLILINGSLMKQGRKATTVDLDPISAPTKTITIKNTTAPINLTISTTLPLSQWKSLLKDKRQVQSVQKGPTSGTVTILLKPGTYELEIAMIGVGTDQMNVEGYYLQNIADKTLQTNAAGRAKIVVEVRDRFNNPVANASVTFTTQYGTFETRTGKPINDDDQSGSTATVTTDSNGLATVWINTTGTLGKILVHTCLGMSCDSETRDVLPNRKQMTFEIISTGGVNSVGQGEASTIIFLEDAYGDNVRSISFVLQNDGIAPINITGIRLQYITVFKDGKVIDGPDAITRISLRTGTSTTVIDIPPAIEGGKPHIFKKSVVLTLVANSESTLTFTFDERYQLRSSNESLTISVEIYFEGGLSATYTVYLHCKDMQNVNCDRSGRGGRGKPNTSIKLHRQFGVSASRHDPEVFHKYIDTQLPHPTRLR